MNGDQTERIPQTDERREISEGGILESASSFAYRVLKEIEALAETTACKSVQLVRLKKWAQEQGCWFDDNGHLYFIDTIIFATGTGGKETYHSLSPRANK